jgi:hypothetical protein
MLGDSSGPCMQKAGKQAAGMQKAGSNRAVSSKRNVHLFHLSIALQISESNHQRRQIIKDVINRTLARVI